MKARIMIALVFFLALLGGAVLAQGGALNYGDNVVGTLSATSPLAFYTFSGTAGDRVTIEVIGITPGLDPAASLNSPTQQQLANNDNDPTEPGSTDALIIHNLPQNGIYTILVNSVSGVSGDYLIRLNGQAVMPTTGLTDSPVDAPVGSGAPPQVFSFNANPAAPTSLTISATTPGFGFQAVVRDANGQIVALLTGDTQVSLTLPASTGTYTVEVTPTDPNTTGQVQISLGQVAAAAPPPPAQTPEVAAPPAQQEPVTSETCVARAPGPQSVNVRNGPGTDFNIIGQIQPGSMVD
ncbi:MAG: pre-peptidase C-terminal domain-containing protein, partial [Anaerolineae bacterium]|nr:pre-peptidase C-terminal domain-containing protein [Anaerolineae bacterium]